jgi:hypothetical protein
VTPNPLAAASSHPSRPIAGDGGADGRARRLAGGNLQMFAVCSAAMAIGFLIDRGLASPLAPTASCGGSESLGAVIAWHWACMPATFLLMGLAGPAWIGFGALAAIRRKPNASTHECPGRPLAALGCHFAMLAGMACALGLEPRVAALLGFSWTSGAAMAAMACGMVCGLAAASLCAKLKATANAAATAYRRASVAIRTARPARTVPISQR